MIVDYYVWLLKRGKVRINSVHSVWSNGKSIRRYQGQGEGNNRSPSKGYRKMTAILIEEVYE